MQHRQSSDPSLCGHPHGYFNSTKSWVNTLGQERTGVGAFRQFYRGIWGPKQSCWVLNRNKKPCLEGAQSESSAPGKQFDGGMAALGARQLRCWLLRDVGCPITSNVQE